MRFQTEMAHKMSNTHKRRAPNYNAMTFKRTIDEEKYLKASRGGEDSYKNKQMAHQGLGTGIVSTFKITSLAGKQQCSNAFKMLSEKLYLTVY